MKFIQLETQHHIGTITIRRPEALNAMNLVVIDELQNAFDQFISDSEVGVIILTGDGEKSFIAGADIKLMASMTKSEALVFSQSGQSLTLKIE
ncbi:MAG: enoyl-CoA hydratase/isomerase family protein, partial [FCB group bacterium]|nr:enoyl-CoA hydratase/isomerase family protein [FCB group bacterium]